MKKYIIRFGLLAVAFMLLLQLSKYSWATYGFRNELLIIVFAISFLVFGILVSEYFLRRKRIPSAQDFVLNEKELKKFAISKREYEVLKAMGKGSSNKEIADSLFISESTVKTHVSNILLKLNSKRRTQAIQRAKEHKLLE